MTEHLNLASGARLDYLVEGDGDALLVYHHGTPAAGPIPHDLITAAATHGFTLVELVRPGYGESTRQPGRSVADVVPLVEALADHLGHERFVTMGWSGGGPHAIATAALLPQRCAAALSLASVAPYGEGDLDFLAGMGEDNIIEFGAALAGAGPLEAFLTEAAGSLRNVTAEQVVYGCGVLFFSFGHNRRNGFFLNGFPVRVQPQRNNVVAVRFVDFFPAVDRGR